MRIHGRRCIPKTQICTFLSCLGMTPMFLLLGGKGVLGDPEGYAHFLLLFLVFVTLKSGIPLTSCVCNKFGYCFIFDLTELGGSSSVCKQTLKPALSIILPTDLLIVTFFEFTTGRSYTSECALGTTITITSTKVLHYRHLNESRGGSMRHGSLTPKPSSILVDLQYF